MNALNLTSQMLILFLDAYLCKVWPVCGARRKATVCCYLNQEFVLCAVDIYHISACCTICSTSATISQKLQLTLLLFLHHQVMGFLD